MFSLELIFLERTILHCDLNGFYASVECFYHPELRPFPVAVAGDPEQRHGIILAKNSVAKKYNIKTGEAIWQAKRKCPNLICLTPNYDLYAKHSQLAREIYQEYSDKVESFGPDECWLDATGGVASFSDGKLLADEIRERIKAELGITASVGVSFNKIFAKLGSDYRKPDATTVISEQNFKEIVWPLSANDMIYVGPSTARKLERFAIHTLGDVANADVEFLKNRLGKAGVVLWQWANGKDYSQVRQYQASPEIKSIGNSTTAPHDLATDNDIRITLRLLSESVASRLRDGNYRCRTVQVSMRQTDLFYYERQMALPYPTAESESIYEAAYRLLCKHSFEEKPLRSVGVRGMNLVDDSVTQLSLYPEIQAMQQQEELERAIDSLRNRFGFQIVKRGLMMTDNALSALDAKGDHTVHPESYFR